MYCCEAGERRSNGLAFQFKRHGVKYYEATQLLSHVYSQSKLGAASSGLRPVERCAWVIFQLPLALLTTRV